jgi:hypothetical protein
MVTNKKRTVPSDEERLDRYFAWLSYQIPKPPLGWELSMKPCKWAKILEERKQNYFK